jgi:hypothetical protein
VGQHGFIPGYSCESQVITLCQDIADSLDERVDIDAIIIEFSKAFCLVPHDRLLTKLAASGVDSSVLAWVREFLCRSYTKGKSRRATIQRSQSNLRCVAREILGPLLFLVYVNGIWRNIGSSIRLFADDCIIY